MNQPPIDGSADIYREIAEANRKARETGRLCYVYELDGLYRSTFTHKKDWLYRVYPGGRKELSLKGSSVVEERKRPF